MELSVSPSSSDSKSSASFTRIRPIAVLVVLCMWAISTLGRFGGLDLADHTITKTQTEETSVINTSILKGQKQLPVILQAPLLTNDDDKNSNKNNIQHPHSNGNVTDVSLSFKTSLAPHRDPTLQSTMKTSTPPRLDSMTFNTTKTTTTDMPWILTLRVQKTASSSLESFVRQWIYQQTGNDIPFLRTICKTIHERDAKDAWTYDFQTPPCNCNLLEQQLIQGKTRSLPETAAFQSHIINGIHADFLDLASWFINGGSCPSPNSTITSTDNSAFEKLPWIERNEQNHSPESRSPESRTTAPLPLTIAVPSLSSKPSSFVTSNIPSNNTLNTSRFTPSFVILTMVRDPIERVQSEYQMLKNYAISNKHHTTFKGWDYQCTNIQTLLDFVTNPKCAIGASNRQTRMIAGVGSNRYWQDIYHSKIQMLEHAKHNLQTWLEFGIVELSKESYLYLDWIAHRSRSNYYDQAISTNYTNLTKSTTYKPTTKSIHERKSRSKQIILPQATRHAIEGANELDLELYEYAVKLFWERFCSTVWEATNEFPNAPCPSILASKKST